MPPLRKAVLAMIAEKPGITSREIRATFPDASLQDVHVAINALKLAHAIEQAGYGAYKATKRRPAPTRYPPEVLARLMAGR
jgi:hypothetical protein